MTNLIDLFWTEDVWLPPNVSWSDLTNYSGNGKGEVNYRKFSDLLIPVFGAFVVIALRFTAEKWDIFQGIFFLNFLPVINYWRGGVSYLLHELMISERLFDLWLKRILKGRLRLNGKYRKCYNFFCRVLFRPFGKFLGLKESVRRNPATNDVLEDLFQQRKRITRNLVRTYNCYFMTLLYFWNLFHLFYKYNLSWTCFLLNLSTSLSFPYETISHQILDLRS